MRDHLRLRLRPQHCPEQLQPGVHQHRRESHHPLMFATDDVPVSARAGDCRSLSLQAVPLQGDRAHGDRRVLCGRLHDGKDLGERQEVGEQQHDPGCGHVHRLPALRLPEPGVGGCPGRDEAQRVRHRGLHGHPGHRLPRAHRLLPAEARARRVGHCLQRRQDDRLPDPGGNVGAQQDHDHVAHSLWRLLLHLQHHPVFDRPHPLAVCHGLRWELQQGCPGLPHPAPALPACA
mmetsp:Transcript_75824/g.171527  ORF Transcript_75824/g.171527 Transcript_75824/m.171527 type:complete len:233 (+) Transcript_75824:519-1217(+)